MNEKRSFPQRTEFTDERDDAIFETYKQVIRKHGENATRLSRSELYEEVVESQAPRFYVTPKTAGRIIAEKLKQRSRR